MNKTHPYPIVWTDGLWHLVEKWRKGDLWKNKCKNNIVVVYQEE